MHFPVGEDENGADKALYQRAEAIKAEGGKPYVIPLGKIENPIGALGYVDALKRSWQKIKGLILLSQGQAVA